jgi:hypothetical protein
MQELFLGAVNGGRTFATYAQNQKEFSPGDLADSASYIQEGKVKASRFILGRKAAG